MKNYLMGVTLGFGALLTFLSFILSILKIIDSSICLGIGIGVFMESMVVFTLIALTMNSNEAN